MVLAAITTCGTQGAAMAKNKQRLELPIELNDRDWLHEHFVVFGMSYGDIALLLRRQYHVYVSRYAVNRSCTDLGVTRRPPPVPPQGGVAMTTRERLRQKRSQQ